ncbi:hypothetical protein ANN_14708 [Periplaneta americana]|uniref:Uncharacterized protein n=1 Tax=Periplaneta americana TaxID=6978 RepID=A0ABQ8SYJ0_PERAM|nr:hypothetical protein ANN_14708 [Periplaneta americana]
MAGLCEGGNEPWSSLKAICISFKSFSPSSPLLVFEYEITVRTASIASAVAWAQNAGHTFHIRGRISKSSRRKDSLAKLTGSGLKADPPGNLIKATISF